MPKDLFSLSKNTVILLDGNLLHVFSIIIFLISLLIKTLAFRPIKHTTYTLNTDTKNDNYTSNKA